MAFLCPVRIRSQKSKKKKELTPIKLTEEIGRLTGSSSIETLSRVGVEKETYIILHSFTPCVDDELEVKEGDMVTLLYRENDWAYVVMEMENREGFIPWSYLQVFDEVVAGVVGGVEGEEFYKDPHPPLYITLYTFTACNENDLTVQRGELVTVLNKEDPDWYWVGRCLDGVEGFVPSAFVFPYTYLKEASKASSSSSSSKEGKGTELVMLYDYKAQAPDDLTLKRGDWVYADLGCQTVDGWLWAWAPRLKKYGFLPKAYARAPAMTSL